MPNCPIQSGAASAGLAIGHDSQKRQRFGMMVIRTDLDRACISAEIPSRRFLRAQFGRAEVLGLI
jgi:hypothetical protein